MTLRELYQTIDGDYDQVMNVLRMEKLLDKHIRKLPANGVVDRLLAAGEKMDSTELFEAAHAMKGVCANLGLKNLSDAASGIAEEYRPGKERKLSDDEVKERIAAIRKMYEHITEEIRKYEASNA